MQLLAEFRIEARHRLELNSGLYQVMAIHSTDKLYTSCRSFQRIGEGRQDPRTETRPVIGPDRLWKKLTNKLGPAEI
jgi:hypothetical protein